MFTVGQLAAFVNLFVLLVVIFLDHVVHEIVKTFLSFRLQRTGRAPVIIDTDVFIFNLPASVYNYRRYPEILLCLSLVLFTFSSELVSEFGVQTSPLCSTVKNSGPVIPQELIHSPPPAPRITSSIFRIRDTEFLEGNLTFISTGFPLYYSPSTCFTCHDRKNDTILVDGCSVSNGELFPAGALKVKIVRTRHRFKAVVSNFINNSNSTDKQRTFSGYGDFTARVYCNMFLFAIEEVPHFKKDISTTSSNKNVLYLEYTDQEHCQEIREAFSPVKRRPMGEDGALIELTRSPVQAEVISCKKNLLTMNYIQMALQEYRTADLESLFPVNTSMNAKYMFNSLTPDYIYRAFYARLLATTVLQNGTFYEYSECAVYKWVFMTPLISTAVIVFILGLVAVFVRQKTEYINIPFSTRSWFSEAIRKKQNEAVQIDHSRTALCFRRTQSAAAKIVDPDGRSYCWKMSNRDQRRIMEGQGEANEEEAHGTRSFVLNTDGRLESRLKSEHSNGQRSVYVSND